MGDNRQAPKIYKTVQTKLRSRGKNHTHDHLAGQQIGTNENVIMQKQNVRSISTLFGETVIRRCIEVTQTHANFNMRSAQIVKGMSLHLNTAQNLSFKLFVF